MKRTNTMSVQERSYWLMRLARVADEASPELGRGITAVIQIQRRQRWRRELRSGHLSDECRHWIAMSDRRGMPVGAAISLGARDGGRGWRRLRNEERLMQVALGHRSFDEQRCEACRRALRNVPLLLLSGLAIVLVLAGIFSQPVVVAQPLRWMLLAILMALASHPLERVLEGYKARCEARLVAEAVERSRAVLEPPDEARDARREEAMSKSDDTWSSVGASWRLLGG
jgi:hypothetical protein